LANTKQLSPEQYHQPVVTVMATTSRTRRQAIPGLAHTADGTYAEVFVRAIAIRPLRAIPRARQR